MYVHVYIITRTYAQVSGRTAAERVEELAVDQELKSKQLRVQRLETQEEAAKLEVSAPH